MTRHTLGSTSFTCVRPGLWIDATGRWMIRRFESKQPGSVPQWTLTDDGVIVARSLSFWDLAASPALSSAP